MFLKNEVLLQILNKELLTDIEEFDRSVYYCKNPLCWHQ